MLSRFPRWSVISCVLLIGTCCIVFASLVLKAREEHDAQASLVLWCSQRANVLTNYLYSVVRSANTYVSMASSPDCRFRTLDSFTVAENVSKLDLTVCTWHILSFDCLRLFCTCVLHLFGFLVVSFFLSVMASFFMCRISGFLLVSYTPWQNSDGFLFNRVIFPVVWIPRVMNRTAFEAETGLTLIYRECPSNDPRLDCGPWFDCLPSYCLLAEIAQLFLLPLFEPIFLCLLLLLFMWSSAVFVSFLVLFPLLVLSVCSGGSCSFAPYCLVIWFLSFSCRKRLPDSASPPHYVIRYVTDMEKGQLAPVLGWDVKADPVREKMTKFSLSTGFPALLPRNNVLFGVQRSAWYKSKTVSYHPLSMSVSV